jgi:hypothetical protein
VGLFTKRHTSAVCKIRDNDLNLTVRSKTSSGIDLSRQGRKERRCMYASESKLIMYRVSG